MGYAKTLRKLAIVPLFIGLPTQANGAEADIVFGTHKATYEMPASELGQITAKAYDKLFEAYAKAPELVKINSTENPELGFEVQRQNGKIGLYATTKTLDNLVLVPGEQTNNFSTSYGGAIHLVVPDRYDSKTNQNKTSKNSGIHIYSLKDGRIYMISEPSKGEVWWKDLPQEEKQKYESLLRENLQLLLGEMGNALAAKQAKILGNK